MQKQHSINDLDCSLGGVTVAKDGDAEDGSSMNQDVSVEATTQNATMKRSLDERRVVIGRTVVVSILALLAIFIATEAYTDVREEEVLDFQTDFKTSANQVIHMANKNARNIYISIETLSVVFPAAAHHSGSKLPYVTASDFEAFGQGARAISKASVIAYSPLLQTMTELMDWNAYSVKHTHWIDEGKHIDNFITEFDDATSQGSNMSLTSEAAGVHETHQDTNISRFVYQFDEKGGLVPAGGEGPFSPIWEMTPVPNDTSTINFNLASNQIFDDLLDFTVLSREPILSAPLNAHELFGNGVGDKYGPVSLFVQPVYDGFEHGKDHKVIGTITAVIPWVSFFEDVLPKDQSGILIVADSCGTNNTYLLHGTTVEFLGQGDLHDKQYDSMEVRASFVEVADDVEFDQCHHIVHIFPTKALEEMHITHTPMFDAGVVLGLFAFTGVVFFIYDKFVGKRQNNTELKASKANAIVRELFPADVATQLFDAADGGAREAKTATHENEDGRYPERNGENAIARLYPTATVLFADIAGFTAWSSIRNPHQVFTLLETVFQAFDRLANKYGIYKVETVGDCYVAVCGIPKFNKSHAVQMARFARDALSTFDETVKSLELTLGPDTGDLGMRIGMHSGPVTAGVLRGDRARFQLFGDTVNTASRMESNGKRDYIHVSEQTAKELILSGKKLWLTSRDDQVELKGKGKYATYWLNRGKENSVNTASESDVSERSTSDLCETIPARTTMKQTGSTDSDRAERLVAWNSDLLLQLLKPIVSRRLGSSSSQIDGSNLAALAKNAGVGTTVAEEVVEYIEMPTCSNSEVSASFEPPEIIVKQLYHYVATIADMYNNNPFHNFEHASHVAMSVNKLLGRIIAPHMDSDCPSGNAHDHSMRDPTYGIKSDPITQFAVVLSALIHDIDHPGVPNGQLIVENPTLGHRYKNRSVAEQNSVDLAWNALMSPEFNDLRAAIFATEVELCKFRQLLVNSVMATDIFDKDLSIMRKMRWSKAFEDGTLVVATNNQEDDQIALNRKATIVIEHLIQASDVAHTMQHWHVYQKWNQRLFNEMYQAYRDGRSGKDPADGWYKGELWFFDNYVIPLTEKLKECGVFGVSSDEYLNYALQNRSEWAERGEAIVQKFVVEYEGRLPPKNQLFSC